jgi:hypothetical protein
MQSVVYIIAIGSVAAFLFWTVHKHERDHKAAMFLKILIVSVGFAAILAPLSSLMRWSQ